MTQQIAAQKDKVSLHEAAYLKFTSTLEEALQEQCALKWAKKRQSVPQILLENYSSSREGLSTPPEQANAVPHSHADRFCPPFDFRGSEAPDNEVFRQRHQLLAESHLQDYEKQAKETGSRQNKFPGTLYRQMGGIYQRGGGISKKQTVPSRTCVLAPILIVSVFPQKVIASLLRDDYGQGHLPGSIFGRPL